MLCHCNFNSCALQLQPPAKPFKSQVNFSPRNKNSCDERKRQGSPPAMDSPVSPRVKFTLVPTGGYLQIKTKECMHSTFLPAYIDNACFSLDSTAISSQTIWSTNVFSLPLDWEETGRNGQQGSRLTRFSPIVSIGFLCCRFVYFVLTSRVIDLWMCTTIFTVVYARTLTDLVPGSHQPSHSSTDLKPVQANQRNSASELASNDVLSDIIIQYFISVDRLITQTTHWGLVLCNMQYLVEIHLCYQKCKQK